MQRRPPAVVLIAVLAAAALVAGSASSLAASARTSDPAAPRAVYRLLAQLRPVSAATGAEGGFFGTGVADGDSVRVTWNLHYSGLSSKVHSAHIHVGRPGAPRATVLRLCFATCRSPLRGTWKATPAGWMMLLRSIRSHRAYVDVHTGTGRAGALRGLVKLITPA